MKQTLKPTAALNEAESKAKHYRKRMRSFIILFAAFLLAYLFCFLDRDIVSIWKYAFHKGFLGGNAKYAVPFVLNFAIVVLLLVQIIRSLILGRKWEIREERLKKSYLVVSSIYMEGTTYSSAEEYPELFCVLLRDVLSVESKEGELNLEIKTATKTYRCLQLSNAEFAKNVYYEYKSRGKNLGGRGIGTDSVPQKVPAMLKQLPEETKAADVVDKGNVALEYGNWTKATEWFQCALCIDPQCAEAYFGLFLAAIKAKTAEKAEVIFTNEVSDLYLSSGYWMQAKRFASEALLKRMNQWEQTRTTNLFEKYETYYQGVAEIVSQIEHFSTKRIENIIDNLSQMQGYRDADVILESFIAESFRRKREHYEELKKEITKDSA